MSMYITVLKKKEKNDKRIRITCRVVAYSIHYIHHGYTPLIKINHHVPKIIVRMRKRWNNIAICIIHIYTVCMKWNLCIFSRPHFALLFIAAYLSSKNSYTSARRVLPEWTIATDVYHKYIFYFCRKRKL
jgi:hypothetical protein